jgi:hypothetical protein
VNLLTKAAKTNNAPKGKEADTVKLAQLPTAAQFKAWKNSVRSAVSSASTDPAAAFKWIMQVENPNLSYNDLAKCARDFTTLDAKLSAALSAFAKVNLEEGSRFAPKRKPKRGNSFAEGKFCGWYMKITESTKKVGHSMTSPIS